MHLKNLVQRRYRCCNDTILIGIYCDYRNFRVRPTTAWQSTPGSQFWANFTYKIIKHVSGSRFHVFFFLIFCELQKVLRLLLFDLWLTTESIELFWLLRDVEKGFRLPWTAIFIRDLFYNAWLSSLGFFFKLEFIYLKLWHFFILTFVSFKINANLLIMLIILISFNLKEITWFKIWRLFYLNICLTKMTGKERPMVDFVPKRSRKFSSLQSLIADNAIV